MLVTRAPGMATSTFMRALVPEMAETTVQIGTPSKARPKNC